MRVQRGFTEEGQARVSVESDSHGRKWGLDQKLLGTATPVPGCGREGGPAEAERRIAPVSL